MNWVLILVVGILAGYTLTGYAKGFVKIVYSLISWLVILIFVIFAAPYIEDYLRNQTGIYEKVVEYCEDAIQKQAQQALEAGKESAVNALAENELFAVIAEKLPEGLLEELQMQTSGVTENLPNIEGLYGKTGVALADMFLQGISTLAAIILGAIVSALLSAVLGFIAKLPVIGFANRILGLAAGAANGLLIVWIAFYLVTLMCTTELGSNIISQIHANEFLTYLYENNLILSMLM